MQKEILIAGFGGQGVLFAGQVLAYAALDIGREVTWIPRTVLKCAAGQPTAPSSSRTRRSARRW